MQLLSCPYRRRILPRLRVAFTLELSVEAAPPPAITPAAEIDVPTSAESWEQVLNDLCNGHQFNVKPELAIPNIEYLVNQHHAAAVPRRVHSGCANKHQEMITKLTDYFGTVSEP